MMTVSLNFVRPATIRHLLQVFRSVNGSEDFLQRKLFHTVRQKLLSDIATRTRGNNTNVAFLVTSTSSDVNRSSTNENGEFPPHTAVLVDEVLQHLSPVNGKLYVDMTFGAGGHTKAILSIAEDARVVCLDRDPEAYDMCLSLKNNYKPGQIIPCLGKFSDLPWLLDEQGIQPGEVDGVLFDVGMSSMQVNESRRGFSFVRNGELDMRMNQTSSVATAADVVNCLDEEDLSKIIRHYGEEEKYKQITHAIILARVAFGKITSTHQLAAIIASVFPVEMKAQCQAATQRTFQALRIFINDELNELNNGIEAAYHFLKPGGHCAAICFHSLEDRIVKRHFCEIDMDEKFNMNLHDQRKRNKDYSMEDVEELIKLKRWTPVNKKIITPTEEEIIRNPRSRSAKLRVAIKN